MTAMADLSRYAEHIDWLTARCTQDPDIKAAWIGGSAVTGGYDDWSDLDVDVLCTPGTATTVHDRVVARFCADFQVKDRWTLPPDAYPDGAQSFLNLQARPGLLDEPTLLVDVLFVDATDEHTHVDARRHGTPLVLHDPDSVLVLRPDDQDKMSAAIDLAVDQVRQRRVTGEWLVNRAIRRGHWGEALDLHLRFALGPVVRLLRVRHCPWRHDYGLRYLRKDLGDELADRVEALVPGHGPGDLAAMSAACFAWLDELLLDSSAV
jgi:hypothetical protein